MSEHAKQFDAKELLETARRRTGLPDFGPDDFREPFEVFVDGLNSEAHIAEDRFDRLYERLLRLLINRLWFAKDLAEHPEILSEDIGAAIVVSTLPRTGSTKLHRLLAASGDFQTLNFWKVHMPSRIPGEPDGGACQRIAATQEHESWMYQTSPAILTGHPQFTHEAEEDQWLMEQSFRHPILFGLFESSRYLQWLMQADMTPTFDYFLAQLKYLQWQSPQDRAKPWLIKSPTHFGNENYLQDIFGSMRLVVTHRDPLKCIPSITSTTAAVRKLYSDYDSSAGAGANLLGMFAHVAKEHMRWRDDNPQVSALDLPFSLINRDGLAAAQKIYDDLGMAMSAQAEARMRQWEANNSREKHGQADYSAAAYGLDEDALEQAFADYKKRFAAYLK